MDLVKTYLRGAIVSREHRPNYEFMNVWSLATILALIPSACDHFMDVRAPNTSKRELWNQLTIKFYADPDTSSRCCSRNLR